MIYGVACLSWPAWWGLQSRWLEAKIKTKILAHLSPLVLFRIQSPSVGLLEAQHPTDCWSGQRITSRKKQCSQTGEAGGQHSQDLSRPEPEHLITTYLGASSYPPRPALGMYSAVFLFSSLQEERGSLAAPSRAVTSSKKSTWLSCASFLFPVLLSPKPCWLMPPTPSQDGLPTGKGDQTQRQPQKRL